MTRNDHNDRQRSRRRSDFSVVSLNSRRPGLEVIQEQYEEENVVSLNDKKFQIYDSHAVDYSRYATTTKKHVESKPKKTKKTLKECPTEILPEKTKETNKDSSERKSPNLKQEETETPSRLDDRRCSVDSSMSCLFPRQPTHDTLTSFLKYYREQRQKDQRIKSIQSRAKVKTPKNTEKKPNISRKDLFLPPIVVRHSENTGNPRTKNRSGRKGKQQLPKIVANQTHVDNMGKDTRFEKLVSTLQPVYSVETSSLSDIISRNGRSYTV